MKEEFFVLCRISMVPRSSSAPVKSASSTAPKPAVAWTSEGFRVARKYQSRLLKALGICAVSGGMLALTPRLSHSDTESMRLLLMAACAVGGTVTAIGLLADWLYLERLRKKFKWIERIGTLPSPSGKPIGYLLYRSDSGSRLVKAPAGAVRSAREIINSASAGKWFDMADKAALYAAIRVALSGGLLKPGDRFVCTFRQEMRPDLEKWLEQAVGYEFQWSEVMAGGAWQELSVQRIEVPRRVSRAGRVPSRQSR